MQEKEGWPDVGIFRKNGLVRRLGKVALQAAILAVIGALAGSPVQVLDDSSDLKS